MSASLFDIREVNLSMTMLRGKRKMLPLILFSFYQIEPTEKKKTILLFTPIQISSVSGQTA